MLGFDLSESLGTTGWVDPGALRHYLEEKVPGAWTLWPFVPDCFLVPAWAFCLVIIGLFTIGWGSKITAPLAWIIWVSTVRRAPVLLYGFDQVLSTLLFYLAVSGASGQAVSLDRVLTRWRRCKAALDRVRFNSSRSDLDMPSAAPEPSVGANLGLRLIQLHLCLIYGLSGLSKLIATEWWTGRAVQILLLTPEFRWLDHSWLLSYPMLLNLATHTGVFLELAYPILIWVRPLRPIVIASMYGLHLGITLLLGLAEFSLTMVTANLSFMSGGYLRSLISGRLQPSVRIAFDSRCPEHCELVALILASDPDRVVKVEDQGKILQSSSASLDRVSGGTFTSIWLVCGERERRRIPLDFRSLPRLLSHLPGMLLLGPWIMIKLAISRSVPKSLHSPSHETSEMNLSTPLVASSLPPPVHRHARRR